MCYLYQPCSSAAALLMLHMLHSSCSGEQNPVSRTVLCCAALQARLQFSAAVPQVAAVRPFLCMYSHCDSTQAWLVCDPTQCIEHCRCLHAQENKNHGWQGNISPPLPPCGSFDRRAVVPCRQARSCMLSARTSFSSCATVASCRRAKHFSSFRHLCCGRRCDAVKSAVRESRSNSSSRTANPLACRG